MDYDKRFQHLEKKCENELYNRRAFRTELCNDICSFLQREDVQLLPRCRNTSEKQFRVLYKLLPCYNQYKITTVDDLNEDDVKWTKQNLHNMLKGSRLIVEDIVRINYYKGLLIHLLYVE